jgi:hypothetical protein
MDESTVEPKENDKAIMEPPRYATNLAMKIEYRREWFYFLWLRGKKLREIAEITGWDESTVWNDLKIVREHLNLQPRSLEQIRTETMLSLRLLHQGILRTIEEAKAIEKVNYQHIRGLYAEAAGIDKLILQRYTQPGTAPEVRAHADEQVMAMIDYITEKLGPESLADFEGWWKGRMATKNLVKDTS